jgi:ATP-dependent Clp protease ATP-binding subunit ClpB
LEDGRLTDGQGRTVDFRNTVVVMTSNLGSDVIQDISRNRSFDTINFEQADQDSGEAVTIDINDNDDENRYEVMKAAVMEVVGNHFRPEFINRIDEVVVFHPLGQGQIRGIASIQLERLRQRLTERDLLLDISDEALDLLAKVGFDPVYGARPLKRAIQQYLENPLAQDVLSGKFGPGDTIHVRVSGDHLVMNP